MNPFKPSFADRFWKAVSAPLKSAAELQENFEYAAITNKLWRAYYLLTEKKVDVGGNDHFAMRWAANGNHVEMIRLLASFGGDPDAKDGEPLIRAVRRGHLEAVGALLSCGACVSCGEYKALHLAVDQHNPDMLQLLLSTQQALLTEVRELKTQAIKAGQAELVAIFSEYQKRFPGGNIAPPKL